MAYRKPTIKRATFVVFRKAWGPRAAFHLTQIKPVCEPDGYRRFKSFLWLIAGGIPLNGAAPSMGFKGL